MIRVHTARVAACCALSILFTTTPVSAQAEAALEEIVVTAQRRAESLQDVPIAITAISGDELEALGVDDIKGITERTPGFTMGTFNAGQAQLYIRGIGSNEDSPAGDQSVIVFIDEIYVGRSAGMDMDLFDLERVEVLRGPQGTLFGKNVVGGAVSVVTAKPDENLDMRFEVSGGDLNLRTFRGLVSGPIADGVYGKFSFSSRKRDGYVDNRIDEFPQFFPNGNEGDKEIGDVDTNSFRGGLRFVPNDRAEINLTASYSKMNQNGPPRHYIGPTGPWFQTEAALLPGYIGNIHDVLQDDVGHSVIDIWGVTGRLDYDFDAFTFTSLTSYRDVDADVDNLNFGGQGIASLRLSSGAAPVILGGSNPYVDRSETFTHEFRFTSNGDGPLEWVAGLYYLEEEAYRNERAQIGVFLTNGAGGSIPIVPIIDGGNEMTNTTESYAVFGQATYNFTDWFRLTLGARQTWEDKDAKLTSTPNGLSASPAFNLKLGDDWSSFTPKATLDFKVAEDAFLYVSYSEGFKSGGFPGGGATELIASTGFDQEEAKLLEVGAKTEWFDNRVRLNVAAFRTDYTDLQILQLLVPENAPPQNPGSLITQNAADAEINGVEVEFSVVPAENWLIQGSYTFLDTEFSDFFIPAGFRAPGVGATPDRTGNELRNAPENAYNLLVRYDHTFANGMGLRLQADFRHKDEVFQDPDELEIAVVPEYDVLDLRASLNFGDGHWTVTGWVKNATDEEYFLHNFPVQNSGFATPALPRTWGVTVNWQN